MLDDAKRFLKLSSRRDRSSIPYLRLVPLSQTGPPDRSVLRLQNLGPFGLILVWGDFVGFVPLQQSAQALLLVGGNRQIRTRNWRKAVRRFRRFGGRRNHGSRWRIRFRRGG